MLKTKTINKSITLENHQFPAEYPSECPICHHHSDIKSKNIARVNKKTDVEIVFQCGFQECERFFIGLYTSYSRTPPYITLKQLIPLLPNLSVFADIIADISPSFVSIYSQAEQAEASGLDQIAGAGYRKSFEFLIKDYAKKISPESEHSNIEVLFSGKVIESYIKEQRIQAVAKRALWLGNDETHYLRKWEDRDIKDLINLIKLTINWIETEQVSNEYIEKMASV